MRQGWASYIGRYHDQNNQIPQMDRNFFSYYGNSVVCLSIDSLQYHHIQYLGSSYAPRWWVPLLAQSAVCRQGGRQKNNQMDRHIFVYYGNSVVCLSINSL